MRSGSSERGRQAPCSTARHQRSSTLNASGGPQLSRGGFRGAAGEVTLAYRHGIPVFLVRTVDPAALSSWAAGCATEVFGGFDELKRHLVERREELVRLG